MDLKKLMQEEAELDRQFFMKNQEDLVESTLEVEEVKKEESTQEEVIIPSEQEDLQVDWKKRFTNYKSSTDVTIRDLRRDLAQATSDIIAYQEKIDELAKEVNALKADKDSSYDDVFTEEDADIVGQDAIDIFKKATKKIAEDSTAPLKKELEELRKKEREAKNKESKDTLDNIYKKYFYDPLKRLVPDFEQINSDPQFLEYLDELDEETGVPRMTLLRNAEKVHDPGRAATFFKGFLKTINKNTLESKITPVANGSSASDSLRQNKPKTFTLEEINKNYSDQSRGVYRGREKEWKILEAQMDKAFATGNIIQ